MSTIEARWQIFRLESTNITVDSRVYSNLAVSWIRTYPFSFHWSLYIRLANFGSIN
ncbi:hypothetical protein BABINDRAFT_162411 [Babjeviella inositovora NRRL Y-12698]|uniref:Uncharacterized protein n=1 Tax=Babjeviella inositovora NRRL Y-12698 TaxID=984486 RepID=A0A1E3QLZ9_9ASCO|nr:uncharacterized protein BABINDRAFT_162411 [Babjeviella inositovora NRRL Y-12698]ODQ78715.1 hypothetical protein BABINDRAFT_162411 [Babjeviella inositovora NRRL Y-12698]